MKRLFCHILIVVLFLSGCSIVGERIKEPVTFYYVRKDYQKDMGNVIGSEVREASGHKGDLSYLLALYSIGPSTEELQSPLPRNTKIVQTERTDISITLSLSDGVLTMSDADFTLASTCIAMTCMELTSVQQVTLSCEDRSITIQENNLLLYSSTQKIQQEETK